MLVAAISVVCAVRALQLGLRGQLRSSFLPPSAGALTSWPDCSRIRSAVRKMLTMVVENRPGASNTVGTEAASRAAPDGNTLLIATLSS